MINVDFTVVETFEKEIAKFFGSRYAVAVDSCTHGIELCLRLTKAASIDVPVRTYLSVPFLSNKLGIPRYWSRIPWSNFYFLTDRVVDAAVLWAKDSYFDGTLMCISFQYQKHLSLGRGGMILCDNEQEYMELKKMSYDGRVPNIPWRNQNIDTVGYHYYMTPETAIMGLDKLPKAIATPPRIWKYKDWPDLTEMDVFKK